MRKWGKNKNRWEDTLRYRRDRCAAAVKKGSGFKDFRISKDEGIRGEQKGPAKTAGPYYQKLSCYLEQVQSNIQLPTTAFPRSLLRDITDIIQTNGIACTGFNST